MALKDQIIHEALRLYSLKGFLGTTIDDILKATHSSKGGFYNHFKSKEDLFHHVLKEARKIWRERNLTGIRQTDTPIDSIKHFLENFRDFYLKDSENFPGGCIFITLLVELKDQAPHLAEEITKGFNGMKGMVKRYLDQAKAAGELKTDADVDAMAEMIFHGMLGAALTYNSGVYGEDSDKAINSIIDYIRDTER